MKNKWDPVDIIVLILVMIIGVVFMIEQIVPLFKEINLSENTSKFMQHGIGAMLAIVSMYIGSRINKKNKPNNEG